MRKLRQLSMAVVLASVVSAPAFAGIVGCPPAPPSPPPDSATATGIVGAPPSAAQPVAPSDPVTEIALSLLTQGLLLAL
jgi:hypothetical protein